MFTSYHKVLSDDRKNDTAETNPFFKRWLCSEEELSVELIQTRWLRHLIRMFPWLGFLDRPVTCGEFASSSCQGVYVFTLTG